MTDVALLALSGCGTTAVGAIAWMVVRLVNAREVRKMLFKSIENCPPEKRAANIKAISTVVGQMSRDHPPTRTGRLPRPGNRRGGSH